MKRLALAFALLIVGACLIIALPLIRVMVFPPEPAGVAAVSVGISEGLVELLALVVVGFVGWKVWRSVRRRRVKQNASR